jgi:hypothetical protein
LPANSKFASEQERADLIEVVAKIARNMFHEMEKEGNELGFMAVLIDREGIHHPIMFIGLEKEEMREAILEQIEEVGAEAVVIIAEAWALDAPVEGMTNEELRLLATKYGSVKNYPWKKEVLALDFEFKMGHKEGWHAHITTTEGGTRYLHEFKWANGSKVLEASGHLQNFFGG